MNQLRQLGLASVVGATSLTFVLAATSVQAAIIATDDFESYTDGSSVLSGTGGTGWTQPWIGNTTTGAPTVQNASSGKIAGYGKSLELGTGVTADNGGLIARQFTQQTGDVYIGMILQTSNNWDGDFWQLYVNNTYSTANGNTSAFSAGILNDTTLNRYFARKGSTSTTATLQHTSADNDIHTFVMKLSKSLGGATDVYDQVSLWVDQSTPGTPTAVLGATDSGTLPATVSTVHVRVSSLESTDRVYLDNLTVATTFAEALPVPEPASGVLLLACGVALTVVRRVHQVGRRCGGIAI